MEPLFLRPPHLRKGYCLHLVSALVSHLSSSISRGRSPPMHTHSHWLDPGPGLPMCGLECMKRGLYLHLCHPSLGECGMNGSIKAGCEDNCQSRQQHPPSFFPRLSLCCLPGKSLLKLSCSYIIAVIVDLHGQPAWIWSHPGDTPQGMSVRACPEGFN